MALVDHDIITHHTKQQDRFQGAFGSTRNFEKKATTYQAQQTTMTSHEQPALPSSCPVVPTDDAVLVDTIKTSDKSTEEFRVYSDMSPPRVIQHYKDMRTFHTVAFYRKMEHKYSFENNMYRRLMTIEEAFEELEHYVVRRSHSSKEK